MTERCNYRAEDTSGVDLTGWTRAQATWEQSAGECSPLRHDPQLPGWFGKISTVINQQRVELLSGIQI